MLIFTVTKDVAKLRYIEPFLKIQTSATLHNHTSVAILIHFIYVCQVNIEFSLRFKIQNRAILPALKAL